MKKKKLKKMGALKKEVRVIFNKYIRLRDSENGYCKCVTCGKVVDNFHAGHLIHGVDFEETNQSGQCCGCNTYRGGLLDVYTLWAIDKYGREEVERLQRLRHKNKRYSRSELENIKEFYQEKIKSLGGVMKVGDKVRIGCPDIYLWNGMKGTVKAICREGKKVEYIVQFKNPTEWCYFRRKDLKHEA